MRFPVTDILDVAMQSPNFHKLHDQLHCRLCELVDDINANIPEWEVTLEHYDTGDYIRFERREPEVV